MKIKKFLFLIFFLLNEVANADAFNIKYSNELEYRHLILRENNFKDSQNEISNLSEIEFRYKNCLKILSNYIYEYNFSSEKEKSHFTKAYIAFLIKDLYIGAGKQLINWGVGRGKNPTNFLKDVEISEKKMKEEALQKGTKCFILTFPIKEFNIESIIPWEKTKKFAAKSSTFIFNTDLSFSLFLSGKNKFYGFDFERPIFKDLFSFYFESSFKDINKYQYLFGISRRLPFLTDCKIDLEYFSKIEEKKLIEDYILLFLNILIREDIRILNCFIFSPQKNFISFMPKVDYSLEGWGFRNLGIGLFSILNWFEEEKDFHYISIELKYGF